MTFEHSKVYRYVSICIEVYHVPEILGSGANIKSFGRQGGKCIMLAVHQVYYCTKKENIPLSVSLGCDVGQVYACKSNGQVAYH